MSLSRFVGVCAAQADAVAKRERRKEARPGELLEAALDLFVEKGFTATRVEEVAARAGVSKGTLFLYFPTKEELFKAVVRKNISGRFDEWTAEMRTFEGTSAEMLRYCMHSWWERVGATRASGITKLMVCEAHNFPEVADFYQREVIVPGHALIRAILQRGIASGEFRALDPEQAIFSVVSSMMFLLMSRHSQGACTCSGQTINPVAYIDSHADLLTRGILASAPPIAAPHRPRHPSTTEGVHAGG